MFVVQINDIFKNYLEIYTYISSLFTDIEYETNIPNIIRNFFDKLNEVFYTFTSLQEYEMNIIMAANISNNIKYLRKIKKSF